MRRDRVRASTTSRRAGADSNGLQEPTCPRGWMSSITASGEFTRPYDQVDGRHDAVILVDALPLDGRRGSSPSSRKSYTIHIGRWLSARETERGLVHEMGLAEAIVDAAVRRAAGRRVTRIRVRIGGHPVDEEIVTMGIAVAAAGTEAEGAAVDLIEEPMSIRCTECGHAVKFFFPAAGSTSEAVKEYRQWKRYMVQ